MSRANASATARSHQKMSGANASATARSNQKMSRANASATARSNQKMSGANASATARSNQLLPIALLVALAFISACDRQNPQEEFNTAVKLQNGDSVPRDSAKAAEWYTKAAKRGYAPA